VVGGRNVDNQTAIAKADGILSLERLLDEQSQRGVTYVSGGRSRCGDFRIQTAVSATATDELVGHRHWPHDISRH